jgi:hypothetical protein
MVEFNAIYAEAALRGCSTDAVRGRDAQAGQSVESATLVPLRTECPSLVEAMIDAEE